MKTKKPCRQDSNNIDAFDDAFDDSNNNAFDDAFNDAFDDANDANENASDDASSTTMTFQAVFKKQIDVFVEEGLDFVLCEVIFIQN